MARGDIGMGLLAAAAGWHDYHTLMQKLDLLEDEVKKHRVVCRRLNGYNIFTKQCSLERTENMRFGSTIEFLDFALDKNVFEKKRVHRKKPLHGSDGDGGACGRGDGGRRAAANDAAEHQPALDHARAAAVRTAERTVRAGTYGAQGPTRVPTGR